MARATNGLGQFRGKVGSVVFRVNQGQQIASAYQPAVRNPKSNLQTAQRNKMYLASQLSKLVPREDIIGLGPRGTARDRRSMFIKNIIENTTSTLVDGVFTSAISNYGIMFSKGNYYEGLSINTDNSNLSLVFNKEVVSEERFNRTAVKVIQIDIINNFLSAYKSSWLNLGVYGTSGDNITIPVNVTKAPGTTTYVFFVPVEVADNVRYSEERKTLVQVDPTSQEIVIVGEYNISNAVLNWYRTIPTAPFNDGEIPPIVPPNTDGDEVVNPDGPSFPNLG